MRGTEKRPTYRRCTWAPDGNTKGYYNSYVMDPKVAAYWNAGYIYDEWHVLAFRAELRKRMSEQDAQFIERWFAQTLQRPRDRKPALLIYGEEGTGKNGLVELLGDLTGYKKEAEQDARTPT